VVNDLSCLPDLEIDHLGAIPPMALCERYDPLSQSHVAVRARRTGWLLLFFRVVTTTEPIH
jgi:hypothetical protein